MKKIVWRYGGGGGMELLYNGSSNEARFSAE
jgi:hypothetical protein